MPKQKGGYKTFITATFTPETRARIKRRKMKCVETEAVDSKTSFAVEIKEAHTAVLRMVYFYHAECQESWGYPGCSDV